MRARPRHRRPADRPARAGARAEQALSGCRVPLAAALAGLLLAGCLDNPAYQRPDLPLPQTWSAEAASGAAPADNWWDGFGDPQLRQLLDQAMAGSPDLQI